MSSGWFKVHLDVSQMTYCIGWVHRLMHMIVVLAPALDLHIVSLLWGNSPLTHWCLVTHICVSKLTIIGSDNGLSPGRRQAIIETKAGMLLIEPLGTNFSEILIEIHIFWFKKMHLKMSSAKWCPFCLGLNVLMQLFDIALSSDWTSCWTNNRCADEFRPCGAHVTSLCHTETLNDYPYGPKIENKRRWKYHQFDEVFFFFSTIIIWTTSAEIIEEKFFKLSIFPFTDMDWASKTRSLTVKCSLGHAYTNMDD